MSRTTMKLGLAIVLASVTAACDENPVDVSRGDQLPSESVRAAVSGSPGDLAQIQGIVSTFDQAWNAGDAVTYAGQYAGAEWVGPTGTILTDPAQITGLYAFLFSVVLANTTRQSVIRSLTFLTGTIAILNIDTRVTGGSTPAGGLRALEKNILVKRAGEWRILQHQQTLVTP
jgi:uncharacterized protein (TIGR02246 family)